MLTAKFYTFSKKARSTARPSSGNTDLSVALKSPASVLSPVIEVGSISNPTVYNYCYLVDFSKYYYINDWVYDRGLWRAYLSEDLLATYKTQIGSTSLYILRSSAQSDGNIVDNMYPTTAAITYARKNYDNYVAPQEPLSFADGVFILGVLGTNGANAQSVIYYELSSADFVSVLTGLYANITANVWGGLAEGVKKSLFDPFQYIVSCNWFPDLPFAKDGSVNDLNIGGWSSGVAAYIVNTQLGGVQNYNFTVQKHPQAASRGAYLNLSPYTRYTLVYLPLGVFDLDTTKIRGNKIYCGTKVDPITGEAVLSVWGDSFGGSDLILTANGQFSVPIAIGQITSNVFGAIGSAAKGLASFALGDYVGSTVSIGNAVASALDNDIKIRGTNGGIINHQLDKFLYSTYYPVVDEDNANQGRPLCKMKTPSSLGGYMMADNVNLSIAATDNELTELTNLLESGFYYE